LRLRGTKSNRDGIGSIVKITTTFGSQVGTVSTAGSYESSSDRRMHFGLGASAEVANIEIRWPSGIVQLMEHIRADRVVDIVEPAANEHAR